MRYTDLIFDLYGTLVDIHTDEGREVWNRTAMYFGLYGARYTGEELEREFYRLLEKKKVQAGQSYECFPDIEFESIMSELFCTRGVTENAEQLGFSAAQLFRVCSIEYIRLYPNVIESLRALRAAGARLWLLTNAQRVFTGYELRLLGLDTEFDGIYISSDHGCRKPDHRFFETLIYERGLNKDKCLMIGNDRAADIAGAAALGIDTLYMHTNLTPQDQAPADPESPYEFEGDDWTELTERILTL